MAAGQLRSLCTIQVRSYWKLFAVPVHPALPAQPIHTMSARNRMMVLARPEISRRFVTLRWTARLTIARRLTNSDTLVGNEHMPCRAPPQRELCD